MYFMTFSERLKQSIEDSGLTLKELALKAGINKRTLENYVGSRQRIPTIEVGFRLAKALGVSVEYLVTGEKTVSNIAEKEFYVNYSKFEKYLRALNTIPKNIYENYEPVYISEVPLIISRYKKMEEYKKYSLPTVILNPDDNDPQIPPYRGPKHLEG